MRPLRALPLALAATLAAAAPAVPPGAGRTGGPNGRPRVAVLPLAARGAPADAWARLKAPLLRALAEGGLEVVDPAAVDEAMRARRLRDPALLERVEAAGLAAALAADLLLVGAVDRCQAGPEPAVSLSGRLIDPRGLRVAGIAFVVVDDRALRKPLGAGGPVTLDRTIGEAARRFAAALAPAAAAGGRGGDPPRASLLAPRPAAVRSGRLEGGKVRRIVILPFRNRTARPGAGGTAADAAAWILARAGGADLVDAGDASRRLLRRGWRTGLPVGREEVLALGREAGVDAVLMGDVDRFDEGGRGRGAPAVALALRLLDARTGAILWAAQHERRGDQTRLVYEIGNVRLAEDLLARALHEALRPLADVLNARIDEGGTGP